MAENKLIMQVRKIKKLIEEKEGNHKGGGGINELKTKNEIEIIKPKIHPLPRLIDKLLARLMKKKATQQYSEKRDHNYK